MVPPTSLPPFPHSYSVGTKTPSPPQPPPSATPSTVVLLHHAEADTSMPPSITRDRPLSSMTLDRDPCIPSSRFIPAVVHLVGAAPTTVSSTVLHHHRLPSQICFHATDSNRYRSTVKISINAYTTPHQRRYSSVSAQLIYRSKKIDRHYTPNAYGCEVAFVRFAPSDPPWHPQHYTPNAYGFPLLYSTLVKSQ